MRTAKILCGATIASLAMLGLQAEAQEAPRWKRHFQEASKAAYRGQLEQVNREVDLLIKDAEELGLATDKTFRGEALGLVRLQVRLQSCAAAERLCVWILENTEKAPELKGWADAFLVHLAAAYAKQGKYPDAELCYRRLLALDFHQNDIALVRGLASVLKAQGKLAEVRPVYERFVNGYRLGRMGGADARSIELRNLASAHMEIGNHAEAEKLLKQALAAEQGTGHTERIFVLLAEIAKSQLAQGRFQEAESQLQELLAEQGRPGGPESIDLLPCLEAYAELLQKTGRASEAGPLAARIGKIRREQRQRTECPRTAPRTLTPILAGKTFRVSSRQGPAGIAAGEGSVWVAAQSGVVRIDPQTGRTVAVNTEASPYGVTVARGSVWVGGDVVTRIDARTNETLAKIKVPGARGVAVGEGAVWVSRIAPEVLKIDPLTNQVGATINTGIRCPGLVGRAIAAGEGGVWFTVDWGLFDWWRGEVFGSYVLRIDPVSLKVVAAIPLEGHIGSVAIGENAVWVTNYNTKTNCPGAVLRINPLTNQVAAAITVGHDPSGLAVGGGAVWVSNALEGTVSRIDPRTNHVTGTLLADARSLALHEGVVWATNPKDATVFSIPLAHGAVGAKKSR